MSAEVKEGAGDSRALVRTASLISGLTLVSRVLGLVREQAFAALLGAGLYADAFNIAFRIPNLLRDLFAEGALSAAFVPTYARVLQEQGRDGAHRLASRLLTVLTVLLGGLMVVAALLASPLVSALAGGFADVPGKHEVTVLLTRVMLPFLPLVSCAAVAMGMLNAEQKYTAPALSPALFNVVTITWAAGLWMMGLPAEEVAFGWALGTVLGGAAQFLVQVPTLRKGGWRFRAQWVPNDPGIRQIAALMGPATLGLAAVQINIFISSYFASHEPSAVSWLNYAFRLLYLPIGLFGVAVSTIATTGLARRAAAGDLEGLRNTLRQALRLLAFLTVPSTAGLMVLAVPIIRLLYERGAFTPRDTPGTATALVLYSLGLVAYTAVKVLAPAFYALGTPRIPLLGSAAAVATNLLVILSLYSVLGFRAVAIGVSAGAWVNALVLGATFERRVGGLLGQGLPALLGRLTASAGVMTVAAWGTLVWVERSFGSTGLSAQLVTALVPIGVGILTYGLATRLLRIPEAAAVGSLLSRRRAQ